jgi:hypothetical protein
MGLPNVFLKMEQAGNKCGLGLCKGCILVAEKSDAEEQKLCFQRRSLIIKINRKTEQSINGYITRRTRDITCTSTYNKQYRTRTWGEQRVKYTTCNWWNWNQVCGKTRQNKWKIKRGSAMEEVVTGCYEVRMYRICIRRLCDNVQFAFILYAMTSHFWECVWKFLSYLIWQKKEIKSIIRFNIR